VIDSSLVILSDSEGSFISVVIRFFATLRMTELWSFVYNHSKFKC